MHIGVCMFATDYAIRPDELARAAEERGFESLWVPEHTHIPTSRRTPFPGGAQLPKEYSHTYDPFVSLMAAAAATKRLKIGTGICLIIERDTITTAKEVASLDALSGKWWSTRTAGGINQANPATWAEVIAKNPDATISAISVDNGGSSGNTTPADQFAAGVDNVIVGFGSDFTRYDFGG